MKLIPNIGTYCVSVRTQKTINQKAILAPAQASDMPKDWTFPWVDIWRSSRTEGQAIIKISVENQVWGLVQYGLYPKNNHQFVAIDSLEANPISRGKNANRLIEPVGKWLIWYCVNVGLQHCSGVEKLVFLFSKAGAFDYYDKKIRMKYTSTVDLGAGEKVHAFEFTRIAAIEYSQLHEKIWGSPTVIDTTTS